MQNFTFHFSMLIGDLIYALPGIGQVCKTYKGQKSPGGEELSGRAVIYMHLDQVWPMADVIKRRNGVTLTQQEFDNMRPLLLAQDYIEDVIPYDGQPFQIDLDEMMGKYGDAINIPYGSLPRWYFQIWPDMTCDLSKRWLTVGENPETEGMIVINRSARSHNPNIDYTFLEKHREQIVFLGLDDEWMSFCKVFFPVTHYKVMDFYHLACVINSAKFFIGNQSFCFAVAEALKVPRILELYSPLPHVIPTGEHAYDFYFQQILEYYVERLNK